MSFIAVGIVGAAAIGAGASVYGGEQQKSAAKKAANAQQDALNLGIRTQRDSQSQALAYLDPFRQYGLNAGATLQQQLYSPEQLQGQQAQERIRMEGELNALKQKQMTFEQWHNERGAQYTGGKGLKRSRGAYADYTTNLTNQIQAAQSKLDIYNKQAESQLAQAQQTQDQPIEASPWYEFQANLLGRDMDRYFAARGLTGSGFEAEQRQRSLIELGAGETERQFARLKGLYDVGANAASVGAGTITGTSQSIANNQVGVGNAQAQGYMGVAGANANAAAGVANSVTGAIGAGLNYAQFQNLINANQTYGMPRTGIVPTGTVGGSASYGTGSNQYLVNPPR